MRATLLMVTVCTIGFQSQIQAQAPVQLQAGVGYARMFDAGGISVAAGVDRLLTGFTTRVQHAVGGSLWYARTGIGSAPNDPEGRRILGLGVRYHVALRSGENFRPFLALPVQLLYSNIPDRTDLVSASLSGTVPEPEPLRPVEDLVGGEWGWGTGVEVGFRVGMGERLSGHTSVQALYQDIYGAGSRHGAWNWHAGISYALSGR